MSAILTLNAGSSSLKVALYARDEETSVLRGQVEKIGIDPHLRLVAATGETIAEDVAADGHDAALAACLSAMERLAPGLRIDAVGHRIVHGGPDRAFPCRLDTATLEDLHRLAPYAPLHQPHNLDGVRAAIAAFPEALQVGAFDTAFHRGHPWVADTFALPREFYDAGVRRYGFHGLSYDFIASRLAVDFPDLYAGRVVVAHLGNGASMCALRAGRSVASTMGFSACDGLPMGTRSGQIDPGVLLYLMTERDMDADAITNLIYSRSGLLGLSGISSDMRTLEASGAPGAAQAIDYFVHRIRRELGALAADLSGLDAVVFTGGIGENSATIRARVADGLGWLGVGIDAAANEAGAEDITASGGAVRVLALPTDEERVIARAVRTIARGD